jgi:hypothetical protein
MNKKDLLRALYYRLRARHVRALDIEYIFLVESGDDKIPREDRVMLIAIPSWRFSLRPLYLTLVLVLFLPSSKFKIAQEGIPKAK